MPTHPAPTGFLKPLVGGLIGAAILLAASTLSTALPSELERVEPICNPELAEEVPAPGERPGRLSSGAEYRLCIPRADWRHLVVFIHGANFGATSISGIRGQIEALDQPSLVDLINAPTLFGLPAPQGAFATLSRLEGIFSEIGKTRAEILELVELFWARARRSGRHRGKTLLFGVSQGGQYAVSLLERDRRGLVDGAISACAPIGDFQRQLNYSGDLLNVFDYYYAELLPAFGLDVDRLVKGKRSARGIQPKVPIKVKRNWLTGKKLERKLARNIRKARKLGGADLDRLRQFLNVTRVATVEQYLESPRATVEEVILTIRGGILGLDEAVATLGSFYDNSARIYSGSDNDLALNLGVQRFHAAPKALRTIARDWESDGAIDRPLVTLHTTSDPRVPFWHEVAYLFKAIAKGSSRFFTPIPVHGFGHCNFAPEDGARALLTVYAKALGVNPQQAKARELQSR